MSSRPRVRFVALLAALGAAGVSAGLVASPAQASQEQTALVTDVPSTATPRVVGGQCYGSVQDMTLCRKVSTMIKIGDWIYAAGIIDKVGDNDGSNVVSGFSNLMRFNARTKLLDPNFRPQLYKTAGRVDDAEVTGLAASADGKTLYAAGRFKTVASSPGATGVIRKGVAAFDPTTGAVKTAFNAKVCSGGGTCTVNAVKFVGPLLWLGGDFTSIGGADRTALAGVSPSNGALSDLVALPVAGKPIATTSTKVTKISVNPSSTKAVLLGNFSSINGQTREEVGLVNADSATGAATGVNTWNAPGLHTAVLNCKKGKIWPQDADWSPDGQFFDIVGSGAGGGHPYPAPCDAFTRWADNGNDSSVPTGYNHTEIDTILSVCSVGQWSYVGGHFKTLNQERRLNGLLVKPPAVQANELHYGLGVIDTSPTNMLAVSNWNHSDQTGRGAGWGAALCVPGPASEGGGVYMGGDSVGVNGNPQVERLAYFAPPPSP